MRAASHKESDYVSTTLAHSRRRLNIRRVLQAMLRRAGYDTVAVEDGQLALEMVQKKGPFDAVITDLKMPQMNGMELLRALTDSFPETPVIMITAHGSVESAVEAVKLGAFDYVEKPFEQNVLRQIVAKATKTAQRDRQHARPLEGRTPSAGRFGLIGSTPAMLEIFDIIERVADTPSTVLISGESGTGKELVAKAPA